MNDREDIEKLLDEIVPSLADRERILEAVDEYIREWEDVIMGDLE